MDQLHHLFGVGEERDPILGLQQEGATFTIPKHPVRRRFHGIQTFNVLRGGEYFFMPSLSALKWLADSKARRGRLRHQQDQSLWTCIYMTAPSAKRRQVLGESYVDRALANADDFNREFQRLVTEYCWGEVWGEETLSPRERSRLTLGMVAALGKMDEFANHVRGAGVNGLTPKELSAVLIQIAVYCGIPVCCRSAFRSQATPEPRARKAENGGPDRSIEPSISKSQHSALERFTHVRSHLRPSRHRRSGHRYHGRLRLPLSESPRHLILIMNVFPDAGPSAIFSDAVIYRLRVRSVSIAPGAPRIRGCD